MSARPSALNRERATAFHLTRSTAELSRGQRSPILILALLGAQDWSKLTRFQLKIRRRISYPRYATIYAQAAHQREPLEREAYRAQPRKFCIPHGLGLDHH
jgi:hypothetical protein